MAYALTNARVFIGDGRVLEAADVLVEGERIKAVNRPGEAIPAEFERIDLTGQTLLPGLIDCHVHLVMDGSPDPIRVAVDANRYTSAFKAARMAERTLRCGFTTVRDLGGMDGIDLALRDAQAQGLILGPRILASGKPVVMTGGHGWLLAREADGPDEFRKAAREQIKAGADVIKVMATGGVVTKGVQPGNAQATEAEMAAAIEEAHKVGLKTATHAQGTEGIMNALRAGVDSIEHGFWLDEAAIEFMLKNGVAYVPTLAAIHFIIVNGEKGVIPVEFVDKAKMVTEAHHKSLERARRAGLLIGSGTDAGTPFNLHGQNGCEPDLLVRAGMSPAEALISATGDAAKILGLEEDLGLVETGKLADLVAVSGVPEDDISLIAEPGGLSLIMQGGRII